MNLSVLENMTVDLTIPLLGGKVHGSLARAGKVRGQTPKVHIGHNDFYHLLNDDNTHAPLQFIMTINRTTFYLILIFNHL